jgi:uncharacterized membrane protein YqgA involved in biofilm formation
MIGTLINFTTVMVGGTLGLLIGGRLPDRLKTIVISAIGLMTIAIGTAAAIKTENALIPLLAQFTAHNSVRDPITREVEVVE